ncbi:hypothetical protein TNCT_215691 [Trichonephila clavata]|uniref:Uncharacterized protein n=1 Tax=Trichonephila clavata TaxID=2740835 RepID=A0A8X6FEC4_TRICU|nr:hypothetical protein TNCT_735191 [Trichonephila clavata]GFQ77246.1 hypothetical protein TNCT_215691 [Trichonephila clavata]
MPLSTFFRPGCRVCVSLNLPAVLTSLHVDASLQAPESTSSAYFSGNWIHLYRAYSSGNWISASAPTLQAPGSPLSRLLFRPR